MERNRIFWGFLFSYIIIAFIPLLLGVTIYSVLLGRLEVNLQAGIEARLNRDIANADNEILSMESLARQLATDPRTKNISTSSAPYRDGATLATIKDIQASISSYGLYSSHHFALLAMYRPEVIFSNYNTFLGFERLYPGYFQMDGLALADWKRLLEACRHTIRTVVAQISWRSDGAMHDSKCLVLMFPLYLEGQYYGHILVAHDVGDRIGDTGSTDLRFLVDREGAVVYASQEDEDERTITMALGEQRSGSAVVHGANGKYLVVWNQLEQADYRVVSALPYEDGMQELVALRNIVAILTACSFILILGICVFVARRNARPMALIQALIRPKAPPEHTLHESLFGIYRAIFDMLRTNDRLLSEISTQHALLEAGFFHQLLTGALAEAHDLDVAFATIGLKRQRPVLLAFLYMPSNQDDETRKALDALRRQTPLVYCERTSNHAKLLIDVSGGDSYEEIIERLTRALEGQLNGPVYAAYGLVADLGNLYAQAQSAESALRTCVIHDLRRPLNCQSLPDGEGGCYYPIDAERQIITATMNGDIETARRLVGDLFAENIAQRQLSLAAYTVFVNELKYTLIKLLDMLPMDQQDKASKLKGLMDEDYLFRSSDELSAAVMNILVDIAEMFKKKRSQYKRNAANEVVTYISQNHKDAQLSLTDIASLFGFTTSYLSSLIKDSTGESFIALLTRVRIEHACQLLLKDIAVKDIAEMVGYNSDIVFRSAFKREMGMTPSEYRRTKTSQPQSAKS